MITYFKINRNSESFWVKINKMYYFGAICTVENVLINNTYSLGDNILVHYDDVIDEM